MTHALITHVSRACLAIGLLLSAPTFAAETPAAAAPPSLSASSDAPASDAAAPIAAAASPAMKSADGHDTTDNPYGLNALWTQSDFVAKGTLLVLALMSLGSWYVIVTKFFEQSKVSGFARKVQEGFWSSASVQEGVEKLHADSPFRFIAEKGLEGASKHEGMLGKIDFNTWVSGSILRAIGNVQSRMQDGLALLATVGSCSPFVGLFGTVWGIYNALVKIGMSGQASIDKVAGPVGESLIMTAIGLAVAVPAVLGYNWLVRRNKSVMEDVKAFGDDLHAVLLASAKK